MNNLKKVTLITLAVLAALILPVTYAIQRGIKADADSKADVIERNIWMPVHYKIVEDKKKWEVAYDSAVTPFLLVSVDEEVYKKEFADAEHEIMVNKAGYVRYRCWQGKVLVTGNFHDTMREAIPRDIYEITSFERLDNGRFVWHVKPDQSGIAKEAIRGFLLGAFHSMLIAGTLAIGFVIIENINTRRRRRMVASTI